MREDNALITISNLKKHFTTSKSIWNKSPKVIKAVDDVSLTINAGEIVALIGESGCGKSTLGRTILRLYPITDGSVQFRDVKLETLSNEEMRKMRLKMQMIFQDPYASLSPRMSIFDSIKAPLDVYQIGTVAERKEKVEALLEYMGLGKNQMYKYPHQLSGGQCQRVLIARAIILNPEFIVCDEPVSALDVSVQSQVLNLMKQIQRERNLSYLFVSHDLSVIRYLCDTVAVMYLGKIVEIGSKKEIFETPAHPYTQALLSAIPTLSTEKKERILLRGTVANSEECKKGCRFYPRCPCARKECMEIEPELKSVGSTHRAACLGVNESYI